MDQQQFTILVGAWLLVGLAAFVFLMFRSAPYGRYARHGWGPGIPNRLAWFLMEIVVLGVFFTVFGVTSMTWNAPTLLFAGLLTLHYVNRGAGLSLAHAYQRQDDAVIDLRRLGRLQHHERLPARLGLSPTTSTGTPPGSPIRVSWVESYCSPAGWP